MFNKIEVNLNAIAHNIRYIRNKLGAETKVIGVVKSNAYGHGLIETARVAWTAGAEVLAVASIEEAVALRLEKIKAPILVLTYIEPEDYHKLLGFDITLSLFDFETAARLSKEARKVNRWAKVDLAVDTGMNRFGFSSEEVLENFRKILMLDHIKVVGIHSHFADAQDRDFSKEQIMRFQNVLFSFQQNKVTLPMAHMAATEACFLYSEAHFDAVRVGLGIYGYSGSVKEEKNNLLPALEFKSVVAQIKRVAPGETIGYGRSFVAKKPMKIAVIPVGYYDGYPRALSNKSFVLISKNRAATVGRVCMNVLMADITGLSVKAGDEVVLIGKRGDDMVYADDLARWAETIPNEILSRLSPAIPREFHFK